MFQWKRSELDGVVFPQWTNAVAAVLIIISIAFIPIMAIHHVVKKGGVKVSLFLFDWQKHQKQMNFRSGGMQTDNALGPAVRREPNWHEVWRETQFRKSERFPRVAAKWSTFVRFKRFISMMMINSLNTVRNTQHSAQTSNSIYYTAIDLFSSISKKNFDDIVQR